MEPLFQDQAEAGRYLAAKLMDYASQPDVLVLGLPRRGVSVAFQVAQAIHAPLDVFIVRKLGVPGHEELAMGAIATGQDFSQTTDQEVHELLRRAAERYPVESNT